MKLLAFILLESILVIFMIWFMILPLFGAPFYPSNLKKLKKVVEQLKLKKNLKIIDLGAGDGRIVTFFAKEGLISHGVEINPFFVFWGNLNLLIRGKFPKSRMIMRNILSHNLSEYDVIYCYLFPAMMKKLESKFEKELKSGAIIISNTFELKAWQPIEKIDKFLIYKKA